MNRRSFSQFGIARLPLLCGVITLATAASVRAGEGDPPTVEQLQAQLAEANTKLGGYADYDTIKGERDKHAGELQKIADKDKTEAQRLADDKKNAEDRATAAETRAKTTALQLSVEREARKLAFIDEDDAVRFIDAAKVEYDADGKPTNVAALLEAVAKAKPHLVAAEAGGTASGGRPNNPSRARQGNAEGTFSRAQLADPKFYQANREAILVAVREGRITN